MSEDLRFKSPLNTTHPVDLRFGEDETGVVDARVSFAITLAPPTVDLDLVAFTLDTVSFSIAMAAPTGAFFTKYDNAVSRGPQAIAKSRWQEGRRSQGSAKTGWDKATPLPVAKRKSWGAATPLPSDTAAHWSTNHPQGRLRQVPWAEATRRAGADRAVSWEQMDSSHKVTLTVAWAQATQLDAPTSTVIWQQMTPSPRPELTAAWQSARRMTESLLAGFQTKAKRTSMSRRLPWEEARRPPPGRSTINPPEPPEIDPCYLPPSGLAVELLFKEQWGGSPNILFVCDRHPPDPGGTVIVPVRRVYIVINNTSLWRVDAMTPIPAFTVSMSLDTDSWTWSFTAALPGSALADVMPDSSGEPVELEVRVNGVSYRFLAESLSRDRTFGSNSLAVRGRGKSALLDTPYSPILSFSNTEARTAQQLMGDVLTDNGVPMDWAINWGLDDWLVPADVFSHQGSYIDALNRIAEAAGGYVQPHAALQQLSVLHRYPVAPWNWATEVTPDFELPSSIATQEGIEWLNKAAYNRVFVSGQQAGILGQITRAGTDGSLVASMVTDALITEVAAARQRGLVTLADTGRQARLTLKLPVLEETGIITPGKWVDFVDGATTRRGIVRGVQVDIGKPEVWQSITLETHEP